MHDNAKAMLLAAFAADAHALGVHWIYNTNVIDKKYGRVETLLAPTLAAYHRGKPAGAFTHYGDQMLVLLESIAEGGFSEARFSRDWQALFQSYDGYVDGATRKTLRNLASGTPITAAGSDSSEMGGAVRIAPLAYAHCDNPAKLVEAARAQTALTHGDALSIDAAELIARTTCAGLAGAPALEALKKVTQDHFAGTTIAELVEEGIESAFLDTRQTIKDFGQGCDTTVVLPGAVHLIARYPGDLRTALVENAMAGGDTAMRAIPAAMVLAAHLGSEAIQPWIDGMTAKIRIEAAAGRIDAK